MIRKIKVSEDQVGLGLGDLHTDTADTVDYAKPPERRPKPKAKAEDSLAKISRIASEHEKIGICKGAARARAFLMDSMSGFGESSSEYQEFLVSVGELDEELEAQYGEEYLRQVKERST